MRDPLGALPHMIPFRALASIVEVSPERAHGTYLPSAGDALVEGTPLPDVMLFEAMAQLGGAIVFGRDSSPAWLSAIDDATIERGPEPGDRIALEVTLDGSFGTLHRFSGRALQNGLQIASSRFVLAARPAGTNG